MNATPARKAASRLRKIYGGDAITLETVERVINEEFASEKTLVDALQKVLLCAVRQQAEGGDILDFQDRLRECADIARVALKKSGTN